MKKISSKRLLIGAIFIYISFNIFCEGVGYISKTYTIKEEDIDLSFTEKGVVIREEYLIRSSIDGNMKINVDDMGKVNTNQSIATIYSNEKYKNIDDEIVQLEKDIKQLKEEGIVNINNEDVLSISNDIKKYSSELSINFQNQDIDKIIKQYENINDEVLKQTSLEGNDLQNITLKTKEEQLKVLKNMKNNNSYDVVSTSPGIVTFTYDDKESIYNKEFLDNIKSEDIEKCKNNYRKTDIDNIKSNDVVARVIGGNEFYIAISTKCEESNKIEKGDSIAIEIDGELLNSNVYDKYKDEENDILIFEINEQNKLFIDTRVEEFDIIYRQMDAIKIKKESLVDKEGKKGIYVINSETQYPEFVELTGESYEDEEFLIIDTMSKDYIENKCIETHDTILENPNIFNTKIKIK